MAPSSKSPCGACQTLKRNCKEECVFAPYFPPEDRHLFLMVHDVFGSNNLAKLLQRVPAQFRNDAVRSFIYEAMFRILNPAYGCVSYIRQLEQQRSHPHNAGGGGGGGEVGGGTPFGIPTTFVASSQTQPQNEQQALLSQHIAAAISHGQQERSNLRFGIGGGGGGGGAESSVRTMVDGRYNPMPSSSNNPLGVQRAESDHQNPQVSPAAVGASLVPHHHNSLQQQPQVSLQQPVGHVPPAQAGDLSLQQQQQQPYTLSQVSPGAAGVHPHYLSLQQEILLPQEQQLHLLQQQGQAQADDDIHSAWPSC